MLNLLHNFEFSSDKALVVIKSVVNFDHRTIVYPRLNALQIINKQTGHIAKLQTI